MATGPRPLGDSPSAGRRRATGTARELADLHGLLVLSMLLFSATDERQIATMVTSSIPTLFPPALICFALARTAGAGWECHGQQAGEPLPPTTEAVLVAALDEGLAEAVFKAGRPVPLRNLAWPGERLIAALPDVPLTNCLCVPAKTFKSSLGLLLVVSETGRFSPHQMFVLNGLATHAAIGAENLRLHQRQSEAIEELTGLNNLIETQHDMLKRVMTIHDQLTRMVLDSRGMDMIVQTLSHLVSNPVAIEDRYFRLIAHSADPRPVDRLRATVIEQKAAPEEFLRDEQVRAAFDRIERERRPIRLPPSPHLGMEHERLVAPIVVGSTISGYVFLVGSNRPLNDLDLMAVEHAGTVLALEMMKEKITFEVEYRLRGDLVDDILRGNYPSEEALYQRASYFGYDLRRPYRLLVMALDPAETRGRSGPDGERQRLDQQREAFALAHALIERRHPQAIVVSRSSSIIALIPVRPGRAAGPADADLVEFARCIQQGVAAGCPAVRLTIGIGGECRAPADYKRAYDQASLCLEALRAMDRVGGVLTFSDLGVYRLFHQVGNREELERFVDELLGPLRAYDQTHGAALLPTLERYLDNDRNIRVTAEALFVHPGTVKYRVKRALELGHIDLAQPEQRLNLHLALKLLAFLGRS